MENRNKKKEAPDSRKTQVPDLSKATEEYNNEVENSELGTEMLDYGNDGPGAGRDDSSARSNDSTSKDRETGRSDANAGGNPI